MSIFWILVIAVGLFYRGMAALEYALSASRGSRQWIPLGDSEEDEESGAPAKSYSHSTLPHVWLKRYVTVPATFGYKSSQDFGWYTVPPRVQSLTLFAFVIMNIVFCLHGYWIFPDNLLYVSSTTTPPTLLPCTSDLRLTMHYLQLPHDT